MNISTEKATSTMGGVRKNYLRRKLLVEYDELFRDVTGAMEVVRDFLASKSAQESSSNGGTEGGLKLWENTRGLEVGAVLKLIGEGLGDGPVNIQGTGRNNQVDLLENSKKNGWKYVSVVNK